LIDAGEQRAEKGWRRAGLELKSKKEGLISENEGREGKRKSRVKF